MLRRLGQADYRTMPWRNGGGTTTELVVAPEGTGLTGERFVYRVSIADVASDGPFSRFEGYDRHILLLDGAGMSLDCGPHGRIELREPLVPHAFSGDWGVHGTLVAGPVRDFNVMVDRARAAAEVEVVTLADGEAVRCAAGTTCILHVIDGDLGGETFVTDAALAWPPEGAGPACVVLARITTK